MKLFIVLLSIAASSFVFPAQLETRQVVELRGTWKFEVGDNENYASAKFNDSKWENIFVPSSWEDEGFPGYNGYAWYRKNFTIPSSDRGKNLYFHGGYIDDVCRIYINGHLIGGRGLFPPSFETAFNQEEILRIPDEYLNFDGDNVVAIRVYDDYQYGGIIRGKVGIYIHPDQWDVTVQLPTLWKFKIGDDAEWSSPTFDDSQWEKLIVPNAWDYQGYQQYDGFGWYRVSFTIPSSMKSEKLFIVLGKIDDVDETFLNGTEIGSTGRMSGFNWKKRINNEYQDMRLYRLPSDKIRYGQKNVIAVRVYDHWRYGGIYEGPIGIITEREYREMRRHYDNNGRNTKNDFERLIDKIFNND